MGTPFPCVPVAFQQWERRSPSKSPRAVPPPRKKFRFCISKWRFLVPSGRYYLQFSCTFYTYKAVLWSWKWLCHAYGEQKTPSQASLLYCCTNTTNHPTPFHSTAHYRPKLKLRWTCKLLSAHLTTRGKFNPWVSLGLCTSLFGALYWTSLHQFTRILLLMKIHALAKLENVTGNLSKETGNFCSNGNYFRPCRQLWV